MDDTPTEFEMNNNHCKENTQTDLLTDSKASGEPLPIPPCYLQHRNIPAIYMSIWERVRVRQQPADDCQFCDQDKLYQTLLLTGLDSDTLAKVWGFVNRTLPGQLTRNELIVMLGIIALLQQHKSDPIQELYQMPNIPIPVFNFDAPPTHNNTDTTTDISSPPQKSSQTLQEDDFADFKSATADDSLCDILKPVPESLRGKTISTVQSEKENETRDKYSYFRDIEHSQVIMRKTMRNSAADEFGDFLSHDTVDSVPLQNLSILDSTPFPSNDSFLPLSSLISSPVDTLKSPPSSVTSAQNKFLKSYNEFLDKVYQILIVNNPEETVGESFASREGENFLLDLLEIQHIFERISGTEEFSSDETLSQSSTVENINSKWNCISRIANKNKVIYDSVREHPSENDTGKCLICNVQTFGDSDSLTFAGIRYHTSCANFWLNCVDNSLPN